MEEHVYKVIELAGASEKSIEDAVQKAISRAGKTLHDLRWFEVVETRGKIDGGKVVNWQVVLKVGFTLNDG
jgi:dodecin